MSKTKLRKFLTQNVNCNQISLNSLSALPVYSKIVSLVSHHCPVHSDMVGRSKIVKAAKRLRASLKLGDERKLCTTCEHKCALAFKPAEGIADFAKDLVRVAVGGAEISDHARHVVEYLKQNTSETPSLTLANNASARRLRREASDRKKQKNSSDPQRSPVLPDYVVSLLPKISNQEETQWVDEDEAEKLIEQLPKEDSIDPLMISDPKKIQRVVAFEGRLIKASLKVRNQAKRISASAPMPSVVPSEASMQSLRKVLRLDRMQDVYETSCVLPGLMNVDAEDFPREIVFTRRLVDKSLDFKATPGRVVQPTPPSDSLKSEIAEMTAINKSTTNDFKFASWTRKLTDVKVKAPPSASRSDEKRSNDQVDHGVVWKFPSIERPQNPEKVVVEQLPVKNTAFVNSAILPVERVRTDSLRKFMRQPEQDDEAKAHKEQRRTEAALKHLLKRSK